jgi:5-methylcytosine-specific restriction protein A
LPKAAPSLFPRQPRTDNRKSAHQRGYDHRWQVARLAYLRRNPLCILCQREDRLTIATVVDHIIPHRGNAKLFWDSANNWAALCARCHNAKTARGQ